MENKFSIDSRIKHIEDLIDLEDSFDMQLTMAVMYPGAIRRSGMCVKKTKMEGDL